MTTIAHFTTVRKYKDLVGVCISPGSAAKEPNPFHIAFVLDTSGSMEGQRLATVQRTLRLFAEELGASDRVSIISYNGAAKICCSVMGTTEGKERMLEAVATLKAGGGTNMEAGISKLLELDLPTVNAVFLLTDGEVNQGLTSVTGLEALVREVAFRRHAIPVYTLGYGDTHNARLLQAMALATRSSYTYAESNEMIPSVVGNILVAMRDEVAKGVVVEWQEVEGGEVECRELGYEGGNSYCVGSLQANKPQWVLLKGTVGTLRIRVGEDAVPLDIPLEGEDVAVLEQDFRIRCAKLLASNEGPMVLLPKFQQLEEDIRASPCHSPLAIRILAEIAEQRARLDAMAAMPPMLATNMPANLVSQHLRTASHMTAFANQRGEDCFNSPTQRQISQQLVSTFNHDPC